MCTSKLTNRFFIVFFILATINYSFAERKSAGVSFNYNGSSSIIWTPDTIYTSGNGSLAANVITCNGQNIPGVISVCHSRTGSGNLFWTQYKLYTTGSGSSTANEVLFNGASIQNIKGVLYNPKGTSALIWTNNNVFLTGNGSLTVNEVKCSNVSITGTSGITFGVNGSSAVIWTQFHVYSVGDFSAVALEVTFNNTPITGTAGVTSCPTGWFFYIWTPSNLFVKGLFSQTVNPVQGVSGVIGVVLSPAGIFPQSALIWNNAHVYTTSPGSLTVNEVTYNSSPITNVNGIVYNPLYAFAHIWNASNLFITGSGSLTVNQVTFNSSPITNLNGFVHNYGGQYALLWNQTNVFTKGYSSLTVNEVKRNNLSITNTKGIIYSPASGSLSTGYIWSETNLLTTGPTSTAANEVLFQQNSIAKIGGLVFSPVSQFGGLIWTPEKVFTTISSSLTANEVLRTISNRPIYSFPKDAATWKSAVIHQDIGQRDSITPGGISASGLTGSTYAKFIFGGSPSASVLNNTNSFANSTIIGAAPYQNTSMFIDNPTMLSCVTGNTVKIYAEVNYSGINIINNKIPDKYELSQNFPNPFNPVTNIRFSVVENTNVKIMVYDATGRETGVLVNEKLEPGIYNINWNGSNYSSGVYFYRMDAGNYSETKKMILVK